MWLCKYLHTICLDLGKECLKQKVVTSPLKFIVVAEPGMLTLIKLPGHLYRLVQLVHAYDKIEDANAWSRGTLMISRENLPQRAK
jgi:hypothetical protein